MEEKRKGEKKKAHRNGVAMGFRVVLWCCIQRAQRAVFSCCVDLCHHQDHPVRSAGDAPAEPSHKQRTAQE